MSLPEIEPRFLDCPVRCLVTTLTSYYSFIPNIIRGGWNRTWDIMGSLLFQQTLNRRKKFVSVLVKYLKAASEPSIQTSFFFVKYTSDGGHTSSVALVQ
jgi:hypothetical protein